MISISFPAVSDDWRLVIDKGGIQIFTKSQPLRVTDCIHGEEISRVDDKTQSRRNAARMACEQNEHAEPL